MLSTAVSFSQTTGRKLYPGMTKTRGSSTVPILRTIAYKWTWSIGIGRASYMGTLCETGDCLFKFKDANFQVNAGLRYRFDPNFSVGGTFRFFSIGASDVEYNSVNDPKQFGRYARNLSFTTNSLELQVYARYDIIPIISKFIGEKADQYNRRNFITPYVFAGGGLLYFNPTAQYQGTAVNLAQTITSREKEEGKFYSQVVPVLSGGVGAQVKIVEFFDIGIDLILSRPFTEYLDDVGGSSKYPTWNLDRSKAPDDVSFALADRHGELKDAAGSPLPRVDPNGVQNFRGKGLDPDNLDASLAKAAKQDYYFILNIRLDYTLSSPLKFYNPRHLHFKGGKGTKGHQFNSR